MSAGKTQVSLKPPSRESMHPFPFGGLSNSRITAAKIVARPFYPSMVKIAKTEVDDTSLVGSPDSIVTVMSIKPGTKTEKYTQALPVAGELLYNPAPSRPAPGNAGGIKPVYAPVAQLDRVGGFEPLGREFESLRVRHIKNPRRKVGFFIW